MHIVICIFLTFYSNKLFIKNGISYDNVMDLIYLNVFCFKIVLKNFLFWLVSTYEKISIAVNTLSMLNKF